MSVELSKTISPSPVEQSTVYGSDLLAHACAAFLVWTAAPILHGMGWPVSATLVSTFFRPEYLEFARQTHVLASLLLAYSGLYIATISMFGILQRRLNSSKKKSFLIRCSH